jgi:DNA-directed RNA polymerase specialized sigma24 family protein
MRRNFSHVLLQLCVEGLDPEEIAMVTDQPLKMVRENLESIQRRLRDEMLAQRAVA